MRLGANLRFLVGDNASDLGLCRLKRSHLGLKLGDLNIELLFHFRLHCSVGTQTITDSHKLCSTIGRFGLKIVLRRDLFGLFCLGYL